ncbi:MAG: cupin domain-containing protein [bacterium]|nr:cupin domain-containing protein [bacterium]
MKSLLVKKNSGQVFNIEGGTKGIIYPDNLSTDSTIVEVSMSGEYPVGGYSINERCTETLFMLEGEFRVRVGEEKYLLSPGDVLTIVPNCKYRIEGNGKVIDFITPRWDKKQNKIIEDNNFTL